MSEQKNWELEVVPVGPLQMNAVILTADGPDGPEAVLFDPGDEAARLLAKIEAKGCRLTHLLATHGHFDHVGGAAEVQQSHDLPLVIHADDMYLVENMPEIQAGYGFPGTDIPRCETSLQDGLTIPFAGQELTVRHVPGHSPGQVMYLVPGLGTPHAIVGDCVFHGSVGRTDLPGGDFATLEKSIRERIYALPDETVIIPGHGPDTTVGHEKATNPFVRA